MVPKPVDPLTAWLQDQAGWLRWLPFIGAALISITLAFDAPHGRKAFEVDWRLTLDALQFSLAKGPHIGASALIALLAVLATGRHRLRLALALSVLVGTGWEIGQTTVIGHNARLSDLGPDAIGALLGCAWGACVLWLLDPARRALPGRRGPIVWQNR